MTDLRGKTALVTGASRGIGKAVALALGRCGANVVCAATSRENAEPTAREIEALGVGVLPLGVRVEEAASVAAMFDQAEQALGTVDILVNNAGIARPVPVLEMTEADWDLPININARSIFLCSQQAARRLKVVGRGGSIINIGSITGENAFPRRLAYCASKAAVNHMTRVMAVEWAELGIRVNCVAPGYIATDIIENLSREGKLDRPKLEGRVPQRRLGKVEEIASAVVFLAGEESSYMTGSIVTVDGGWDAYGFV